MPDERGSFKFKEEVLPRLVAAYEAGALTPFLGLGMSRPKCVAWTTLIASLENVLSGKPSTLNDDTKTEELIQRANRVVHMLRARSKGEFETALNGALFSKDDRMPEQMKALAKIWWPLVLTTNYDDLFVKEFSDVFDSSLIAAVGRNSEDCQRVLTSLTTAGRTLLWALQGHLSSRAHEEMFRREKRLGKELVIDHSEYRRVTNREPHFRRAFAEVFRHRSLLFLGSGLRENYLQELFGEVLELYGPSSRTHYAIMPRDEVDPEFMYSRFQIAVVEYDASKEKDKHKEVLEYLELLREETEKAQSAPVIWSWGRPQTTDQVVAPSDAPVEVPAPSDAPLEVVRGPLPMIHVKGECLVVSAGGKTSGDGFVVSPKLQPTVNAWCASVPPPPGSAPAETKPVPVVTKLSPWVGEYVGCHAFAVRARKEDKDEKDLLSIFDASQALFDLAADRGYRRICMQLLAAGGKDNKDGVQRPWSARAFPKRFAFAEMVRAWGDWRRSHTGRKLCLTLHVVDPEVYREIASGRIDVLELLLCEDLRFWTETVEDDVIAERRLFQLPESTKLRDIVDKLYLDVEYWTFEVSPPTDISTVVGGVRLDASIDGSPYYSLKLRELGVVPGSTLHFRRE